jgi:Uma2 family endonuclease
MVVSASKTILRSSVALLSDVTWETLAKLDEDMAGTGARLTYLDGLLEIMAPLSDEHETPKKTCAQLIEAYMRVKKIRFYASGSATLGMKAVGARKEPDESYSLGEHKSIPDLAIEITATSGGIDVLEIYQRIGVQEVWFWEDGVIEVYVLRSPSAQAELSPSAQAELSPSAQAELSTGYELVRQSELLPNLDLRSLEFHSRMADQYDAVEAFIQTIQN